jgi:hypothetical protein
LREDLPGAEEVNGQIKADYAGYLGMEPEVFPYEEQGFDYPLVHIYYEAYRFDHLLELVVRYQCYSLYGSGLSSYNTVYCYDTKGETLCSVTRLMEQLAISEKDVVNRYMEFYMMEDTRQDPLAFDLTSELWEERRQRRSSTGSRSRNSRETHQMADSPTRV